MMYAFRSCLLSPDEAICPVSADLLKFYFLTLYLKYVVSGLKMNLMSIDLFCVCVGGSKRHFKRMHKRNKVL